MMGEGDITRYVGNVLAVIATDKKGKAGRNRGAGGSGLHRTACGYESL